MGVLEPSRGLRLLVGVIVAVVGCGEQMATMAGATRRVDFALLGLGGVGSALVEAIIGAREHHAARYGLRLEACLVADSSGVLCAAEGLSDDALRAAIAAKAAGGRVGELVGAERAPAGGDAGAFLAGALGRLTPGAVVVDCTASDATTAALVAAAGPLRLKVASANKKPFAGPQATYDLLVADPARVRHESTVGAGLPAIAALDRLVAADDPVSKIAGTFSGTLGYVMTGLQNGRKFSEIVLEAKGLGYTEPDPRDDLGGVDVAREARGGQKKGDSTSTFVSWDAIVPGKGIQLSRTLREMIARPNMRQIDLANDGERRVQGSSRRCAAQARPSSSRAASAGSSRWPTSTSRPSTPRPSPT